MPALRRHLPIGARARDERGVSLLIAMFLMLVIATVSAALIQYAGKDRVAAGRMSVQERGVACAEAGIQYGRRYFACNYKATNNWNSILDGTVPGRYDPAIDLYPDTLGAIPGVLKGDIDGDGVPDFWVSIRDDDDERPLGKPDDPRRDNNQVVYLRAECINPAFVIDAGGQRRTAVLEVMLAYVSNLVNPYGKATSASDFPEASAGGAAVLTAQPQNGCDSETGTGGRL